MPVVANEPQAHSLAAKIPHLEPEAADKPRVLIPGALKLTRDQEDRLVAHIQRQKQVLTEEHGLRDFSQDNWYSTAMDASGAFERKYLDTQQMALLTYAMKFGWRPAVMGGIFAESNLHLPLTRRILQQQIARLISYFTGTEPYFSIYDVGSDDKDLSEKLDRWVRHLLDSENDTRADINAGIERASICSAAIYALSYQEDIRFYQREMEVLIGPDGKPLLAADGDFIIKDVDTFAAGPDGLVVLVRDGKTQEPPNAVYESQLIWRKALLKEGPKADLLMPADFLWSLEAETLDKADITWHRTSETLISLVHRYQRSMRKLAPDKIIAQVGLMLARLLPGATNTPDTSAKQPRPELSEPGSSIGTDQAEPLLNIGRFCLNYDANQDGDMEDILVILTEDGYPIVYDYVANFTPDHRRPYRRLRINPVSGRVHGQGNVEVFEELQKDADLVLNRWNFAQSGSGRVTFWRPDRTVEGQADPHLKLNNGGTYTPTGNFKPEEILGYVSLPDLKSMDLKAMLEFLMQIGMNMSGVANTNDAGVAGLEQTKLATGIREIEKSGMELSGKNVADLAPDVRDLVRSLAFLAIAHLDGPRAFKFFNGDVASIATISRQEVRNVSLDASLELTKFRGEQEAAQTQAATAAAKEFYTLPPIVQTRLAGLYRQMLKAFQVKDVEEIIQALPVDLPPEILVALGLLDPATLPPPGPGSAEPGQPPAPAPSAV